MNQSTNSTPQSWAYLPSLPKKKQKQLLRVFWFIASALIFYEFFLVEDTPFLSKLGAVLITAAALWPNYLWCSGRAKGMPIFPFFALTHIWTYGLPLVTDHPTVLTYSPESHLVASCTVAGFLILGTSVWFSFVKSAPKIPKYYRALTDRKGNAFFFFILIAGVFFNVSIYGQWEWLSMIGGLFTALRAGVLGLNALATFVLSYKLGNKELTKAQGILFVFLVVAYMVTSSLGYLLYGAAGTFLLTVVAFTISSKRVPIIVIVIFFLCFSLLHYGKGAMRAKYWGNHAAVLQPWEYPERYSEWIGYSLEYMNKQKKKDDLPSSEEKKSSFFERASVIQILLLAQKKSPETVPFLYGQTYSILPQLVVPRVLNPNKIWALESTSLLNIHYKLQTREQTLTTTIGWGLLAESYANFGFVGCGGLAIILGAAYGKATRWSINAPILSVQSLFAVMMMSFAFQSESTSGEIVAGLSQSSTVLTGIALFLMQKQRVPIYGYPPGRIN